MKKHPLHFENFEKIDFFELLNTLDPNYEPHVLSCGAGVDSLALLIEYILNPKSRDFPLCNLIVIHAVVGGESHETKRMMEEVIFPLCRLHNIWFIQAYRNGETEKDGVTILSSTRQPTTFYLRGDYCLFTYLILSGTVPQRSSKGGRLCTLKFKGWVIDQICLHLFQDSPRQRYIGFNADEMTRLKQEYSHSPQYIIGYNNDEHHRLKDLAGQGFEYEIAFNADEVSRSNKESSDRNIVFRFPLIEMGLGRAWCEARLNEFATMWSQGQIPTGRKSFCLNSCPFPECNGKKRQRGNNTHGDLREDWLREPEYGGEAAFIERISLAINAYQPLYTGQYVIEILHETGNAFAILHYNELLKGAWIPSALPHLNQMGSSTQKQIEQLLQGNIWAVYRVRRIFDIDASMPFRQTRILFQGIESDAHQYLWDLAAKYDQIPSLTALNYRFWTIERPYKEVATTKGQTKLVPAPRPYVEEFFVAAPATVYDKQRINDENYNLRWLAITGVLPYTRGIDHYESTPTVSRVIQDGIRRGRRL